MLSSGAAGAKEKPLNDFSGVIMTVRTETRHPMDRPRPVSFEKPKQSILVHLHANKLQPKQVQALKQDYPIVDTFGMCFWAASDGKGTCNAANLQG